jgi:hypothetical protein
MVLPFIIGVAVVFGLSGGGLRCLKRTLRASLSIKVTAATQFEFVLAHGSASASTDILVDDGVCLSVPNLQ